MANNIGKKQIATYKNKVVEIVPEYNQQGAPKETITITKTSVIQGTYAPYSNNEQTEGMYIQAHTINDSNYRTGDWDEYEPHQLVAKDDLNYRFLLPTGEDNTSPTYNALLASCVHSSNTDRTISRDEGHNIYETTLTPEDGYSKVPAGRIEKQKGNGTWDSVQSWNTPLDSVTIRIQDVDGNLRFVFNSNCIYELTVYTTIDGVPQPDPLVIEGICETPINVDDYAQSIPGKTFVNITKDGTPISGEQDFCENTSIYVNYTTNEYTVTNGIDPNCATVEISNPTPEYGDTVVIIIRKKSDKANIGAGSISMEGASNPIYSWNKTVESTLRYSIDSVIGSITIDSNECGDPANHPVRLEWYNDEEPESNPVITSINVSHGSIIHPNDHDCISTFPLQTRYEIKYSNPAMDSEISITDDNTVIQYHYGLKEYKVTYNGDSTVTINISESGKVKHGEDITTDNVYTIESGYQNANAIIISGTATGVSINNGSVTVTGVTSNVTVKISADSIPTHNYCVRFSIEQAGTIGGDEPYCSTIQEGTCHEDISYSLNSGYEIYGEIPSQITINNDNTIDVCNITEDIELVIPVRPITHTVKYCLTDGQGMSLVGAQGQCITKNVVHGQNSTQGFSLRSGYNSVIIDSITPQDKPYNIDYDNNTININNITENVEIWMHADAIPNQNVTFKLFIDGVEKPDLETTKSVAYGSTATHSFRSLGIVIDRTDVNVTADVAGVTTNYSILSDAAIGVSGTPITEATIITTYIKSVPQKEVQSIEITSSKMDAMGGVVFNGKINYSEGEPDIITDQTQFNRLFAVTDTSNNDLYDAVVTVHDYDFEPGDLSITREEKSSIEKTKLTLESTDEDHYNNTTHEYVDRNVVVTLKGTNISTNPFTIKQRKERYGYYDGGNIESESDTSDLSNAYWKTGYLVDFGDSVEMYEPSSEFIPNELQGKDIYNKDITPYYITGTYIGENPLGNLSGNAYHINGNVNNYNAINNNEEHYHIVWGEGEGMSSGFAFNKGYIFSSDEFTVEQNMCGGIPSDPYQTSCDDAYSSTDDEGILESLGTNYEGSNPNYKVTKNLDYTYTIRYRQPRHNYGIDSISYYHIDNSPYQTEVVNGVFTDASEQSKQWTYPLHIKSNDSNDSIPYPHTVHTLDFGGQREFGAGPTLGMMNTVRWKNIVSDPAYNPDDSDYKDNYYYNIYYDYNNKIDLYNDSTLVFSRYNNTWYNSNVSEQFNKLKLSSTYDGPDGSTFFGGYVPYGRVIDAYSTFMSSERLIRPIIRDNTDVKFAVLKGVYNNRNASISTNNTQNSIVELSLQDYCALMGRRTRFISEAVMYNMLNQGYGYHNPDAIQGNTEIDSNTYSIPAFVNYPYNIEDQYNVDYDRIWIPDPVIGGNNVLRAEVYVNTNGDLSYVYPKYETELIDGTLVYKLDTNNNRIQETDSNDNPVYIYVPEDTEGYVNDNNYVKNIYNKIAVSQFRQNNKSNDMDMNSYAHNSDFAKFAICSDNFITASSARISVNYTDRTKDILLAGLRSITRDQSTGLYRVVTAVPVSGGTQEGSDNVIYANNISMNSTNGEFYYRQTVPISSDYDIYTNMTTIKITVSDFDENQKPFGIGNITCIVDGDTNSPYEWNYGTEYYPGTPLIGISGLTPGDHKISIKVSSENNPESLNEYTSEENKNVQTSGNTVVVTCENGADSRKFFIPIGGSCDRDDNQNDSGIDLSWAQLKQYYQETCTSGDDCQDGKRDFSNRGRYLYILKTVAPGVTIDVRNL